MDARVVIIGGGIAGCTAALGLADRGVGAVLVRPSPGPADAASFHAQGGIVYRGRGDSPESLTEDIWMAGCRCGSSEMISLIAHRGAEAVEKILLDRLDIPFDRDSGGGLSLTMEAAHSCSRIIHSRDATGRAIMNALNAAVAAHPGIFCMDGWTAIDLLSSDEICRGAEIINARGELRTLYSPVTILATGGAGSLFYRTSNPPGSLGQGQAMAARAGAVLRDMEYIQFHPTALALPGADPFLISEAVRGAGARLVTPDNRPFMEKYSADWRDLAPRDVVSRAIYEEMRASGLPHVCLNLFDYIKPADITARFPTISERCRQNGVDISREILPVAPAAHFSCGGIAVDRQAATSIPGLFAVGECSCTGIHGANRLASTSLLEGLLWADLAAEGIAGEIQRRGKVPAPVRIGREDSGRSTGREESSGVDETARRVKSIMWEKVGIIRRSNLLEEAVSELHELKLRAEELYGCGRPAVKTAGLRNMTSAAVLIAEAALKNRLSRGCHFIVS